MSQIVDDLRQVAIEIKTETQVGGNTAARVGGAFERVADALEGTQQIEDMDAAVAAVQQAAQENKQTIQNIVNSLAVVQTKGQSTSSVMSQKAVTDELNNLSENLRIGENEIVFLKVSSPINTGSSADSDLDITDNDGNVLARFEHGNIKTKYFNSENAVEAETYPTIQEDLDITDEDKKVLVRFKNGHIQTKYFDSSVGRGAYSSSTIRFTVDVNVNMLKDSEDSASVQDSYVGTYKDNGLLMLPPTYTPQGKPTRLVIAFHGGGGGASDHDSQTEQQTQYKYLVANGYAVMDMNGMPADWVETWWDDCPAPSVKEYCKVNNMGTPLAMECYMKGYQWVVDNYNIARDGVFICGGSMGGMSSSNFVMMGSVPVIAQAIYAPALDTYNQAFLHPWTPVSNPVLSKYCLGKLYGFSKDGNDQYIYDADKVTGYNPIINGMESYVNGERVTSVGTYDFTTHYLNGVEVTEYKRYPCPLKIWHCDNDPTVNIACSIRQVTAIKNAGGMAWLRRFPSGGHAPDTAGTVVSNPSGNTILNGASVGTIYPLAEETLLFFNRFNNK